VVAVGCRQQIRNDVIWWAEWVAEVACLAVVEPGVARLLPVSGDLAVSRPPGDGAATGQLVATLCQPSIHLGDGPLGEFLA
jgi:hypothetical protein